MYISERNSIVSRTWHRINQNVCAQIYMMWAGGEIMPENIIDILSKIESVKGEEYTKGLVDGVNLATKEPNQEETRPA